jgi:two-component system nitrate/nitrite response regulator NarL
MIFTQKEMAQATTSFESRFRLAYLSVDFNPTVVFACHSKILLANVYRGMVIKRHFLGGATTGSGALELVARFKPNILAITDDLPDLSVDSVISQAKQIQPTLRSAVFVTNLNAFSGFRDCPIVVAEPDVLDHPTTTGFLSLALITNTSFFSPSIQDRLQQLEQSPPNEYPGTVPLTLRERQLLEAYALGLSNEETANKLGLSVRSVQTYSGNLLKKLGTNNRQRALRRALSLGLTELSHLFD